MLSIDLQQIIQDINARRNRVRYEFQELGLMLCDKLHDPRHKSLYMKLAKYEEQELLMDAMHYVLDSPGVNGNVGALFMWKLKELKARPLLPLIIRYDVVGEVITEETAGKARTSFAPITPASSINGTTPIVKNIPASYFSVGTITRVTRGDMPLLLAAFTQFQAENDASKISVTIENGLVAYPDAKDLAVLLIMRKLPEFLKEFFKEYEKTLMISMFSRWQINQSEYYNLNNGVQMVKGTLKISAPRLTKREFQRRMPRT